MQSFGTFSRSIPPLPLPLSRSLVFRCLFRGATSGRESSRRRTKSPVHLFSFVCSSGSLCNSCESDSIGGKREEIGPFQCLFVAVSCQSSLSCLWLAGWLAAGAIADQANIVFSSAQLPPRPPPTPPHPLPASLLQSLHCVIDFRKAPMYTCIHLVQIYTAAHSTSNGASASESAQLAPNCAIDRSNSSNSYQSHSKSHRSISFSLCLCLSPSPFSAHLAINFSAVQFHFPAQSI